MKIVLIVVCFGFALLFQAAEVYSWNEFFKHLEVSRRRRRSGQAFLRD